MGNMFSCGGLLGKLQTRLRSDLEAALEARLQEIEVDLTDESITSSDCSGDTTWNGDLGGEVAEDQTPFSEDSYKVEDVFKPPKTPVILTPRGDETPTPEPTGVPPTPVNGECNSRTVIQRVVMILEAALRNGELEPPKPKGPSELSQFYSNRNWKTSARKGKLAAMFGTDANVFAVEPEKYLKLLRAHNARRGHIIFHYGVSISSWGSSSM